MAEALEDTSSECVDRSNDANSFLNNQFDIFVHDYREYTDAQACGCGEGIEDAECSKPHSSAVPKKHLVNVTRRLQKAVFSLQSLPSKDAFADLIAELQGLHSVLSRSLNGQQAEFAPSNVPLPEFDTGDMQLLLGESEVPNSKPMLQQVEEEKKKADERLQGLIVQAEVLLKQATHAKEGLPK